MSEFNKHLYLILFPNEALVASQLTPSEFGKHYSIGSPRHFSGKVIFVEVDIQYRSEYLRIDECLKETESGIPGRPKRTKFVKSYRVLEHMDFSAFQKLYLVTTDGGVLGLDKSELLPISAYTNRVRLFQEICPFLGNDLGFERRHVTHPVEKSVYSCVQFEFSLFHPLPPLVAPRCGAMIRSPGGART